MVDFPEVLSIVENTIGLARENPVPDEPTPSDAYLAWAIMNELRRAGFKLMPKDEPGKDMSDTAPAITFPSEPAATDKPAVHCCENMRFSSSGCDGFGYKKSQHVEYRSGSGCYLIADETGAFYLAVHYCPWCGTDLTPLRRLPSVEPDET